MTNGGRQSSSSEAVAALPQQQQQSSAAAATTTQYQEMTAMAVPATTTMALEVEQEEAPAYKKNETDGLCTIIQRWFLKSAWPGLGLFGESYILFGIGTLQPIWMILYPNCYADGNGDGSNQDDDDNNNNNNADDATSSSSSSCPLWIVQSLTYSVVAGVIIGMIVVGLIANTIGRRQGSLLTASLMAGGAVAMVIVQFVFGSNSNDNSNSNEPRLFLSLSLLLFVFGIGVGGEYPLSASSASEKATQEMMDQQDVMEGRLADMMNNGNSKHNNNKNNAKDEPVVAIDKTTPLMINTTTSGAAAKTEPPLHLPPSLPAKQQKEHRGRQIQLVFTMQGMGVWVNSLTITFLLWVMGQTGGQGSYDASRLLAVSQLTYLFGAFVLVSVLVSRYLYLEESQVWAHDKKRRELADEAAAAAPKETKSSNTANRVGNDDHVSAAGVVPGGRGGVLDAAGNTVVPPEPLATPILIHAATISDLSNPTLILQQEEYERQIMEDTESFDVDEDLNASKYVLLFRNYGIRLFGASMAWLLWDISFYGNKLFQATFLLALTGEETTLLEFAAAATLNSTIALLGYFGAAALIDRPEIGRLKLQAYGFVITGGFFVLCGFSFDHLSSGWLVAMYMGSSFFGQLGPNATTFNIPAEIFPTEQRTLCHGICAASGKLGALIAAVLFHHVPNDADMFLLSGYASFAACLISIWTIPEMTGLNLLELDVKWRMTLEGRKGDYRGPANHPDHLSMYERWKKGASIQSATPLANDWEDYVD